MINVICLAMACIALVFAYVMWVLIAKAFKEQEARIARIAEYETFIKESCKMKPFDLEAAKAGAKIVTRYGEEIKRFNYWPDAKEGERVEAWVQGGPVLYHDSGKFALNGETWIDLFMADTENQQ